MRDLLRLVTCGSVDDGKSTLIGRLLLDAGVVPTDQLEALVRDSARHGNAGLGQIDPALLVDGLEAEREQGITIDVAYRFFDSGRRRFIVADTPGHVQYTRNMATGASNADAAVLLVDARAGVSPQTRRHALIVARMGIRQLVLAVNKMDLVGWDRGVFEAIADDFSRLVGALGVPQAHAVPVSALHGDNVRERSSHAPWYEGPTLLAQLEALPRRSREDRPFRLPVQWVNRPHGDFRGYAGTLASGRVRPGDAVVVLPSGRQTRVDRIVTQDGDLAEAKGGQAVTLTLHDELDISRGDVLAAVDEPPASADLLTADVVWMDDAPLVPGRRYQLCLGTARVPARALRIRYTIDVDTGAHQAARTLRLNDIGSCEFALERPIPFEPYAVSRELGGFMLVDRMTHATSACGMIDFAPRRAHTIHPPEMTVGPDARAAHKGARPCVLWFTGLSGAGKSTLADAVERLLYSEGFHTMLLDGDHLRQGLNRDLGFREADRVENVRRTAEVARLMVDAGLIVLVSLISPYQADRDAARQRFRAGEFIEIFVDTPLAVCEARDPKGLYRKARAGLLPGFTGIDAPYEPPRQPELVLSTDGTDPDPLAWQVLRHLRARGAV